jgi:predicted DNA-binding protein
MKLTVQVPVRLSAEDNQLLCQLAKKRKATRASIIRKAVQAYLKTDAPEYYPPGSLAQYYTAERDQEELQLLKGCTLKIEDSE